MGTPDSDPLPQLKLAILNFKVKFLIWYNKRPGAVKIVAVLLLLCGFLFSKIRITVVTSAEGNGQSTGRWERGEPARRAERNQKLRTLFDHRSPVLLDLQGIRDPYPADLEKYKKKLFKENMFNTWESDHTPINRLHPDMRTKRCKARVGSYLPVSDLPSVSVVFIFVDECLSVLLRSIVSILLTTPPELLKNIVLVDDASGKGFIMRIIFEINLCSVSSSPSPCAQFSQLN